MALEDVTKEAQVTNFEDASKAGLDLLNQQQQNPAVEEPPAQPPVEPVQPTEPAANPPVEQQTTADAAKLVADKAAEVEAQLQQTQTRYAQDVGALQQKINEMQQQMQQMAEQQQTAVIEQVLEKPVMDFSALNYADEESAKQMQNDFAEKMAAYTSAQAKKDIEAQFAPLLEKVKMSEQQSQKSQMIEQLAADPEFAGIRDMVPHMDQIIANHSALKNSPIDEQLMSAYAIALGMNAKMTPPPTPPPAPTADDFMKLYNSDPEFQKLVEQKRLEAIKPSQQVPPMSAGADNIALTIPKKPTNWDEASAAAQKYFR